jgi:hypothetical protein
MTVKASPPGKSHPSAVKLVMVCALLAMDCAGGRVDELPGVQGDLLAGASPAHSTGVSHPQRMTDGILATEGDFWHTDLTSVVGNHGAIVWDLGRVQEIHCGVLQGDNNDIYQLAGSEDGARFSPLWTAEPIGKPGMQMRLSQHIDKTARYVRLSAQGGDGFYSVGELALFASCPKEWPPRLIAREGSSEEEAAQWKLVIFGIASIAFLLLNRRGSRDWVRLAVAIPLGLGLSAFMDLKEMWPIDDDKGQTFIRAVVAAITATILLREWLWPDRYPVHKRATAAALVFLSVVSVGCYYHFGMPQFRDEAKDRTTLVHPWDMRNYFPVAKYFDELRYDGLYLGSVAAHLDNHPGMSFDAVANVHMRDLTTNEITTARELKGQIDDIRKRFSPGRWESFKKDMKYFEDVMGAGSYLGSMQDHGGNATPVWMMVARLMWKNTPASETTLTVTALVDPLLWALLFAVIARTFGMRVMLVTLIVWGTTDFSRFGTNLMGSTLRADWMVALGLGACALKKERWALGGGLLAYGGLIRAFPAFAAIFLAVPPLWWLVDRAREKGKLRAEGDFVRAQAPALRALAGAAGTVVILVALSSAVFGFSASWGTWTRKIVLHAEQPNSNHVGIRNLVAFSPDLVAQRVADSRRLEPWSAWQDAQRQTFARRKPIFYLAVLAFLGAAVLACRRARLEQAAIIGLMMIPVLFYPANYYCHYVFLLPLVATRAGPARPLLEPEGRTLFARVSALVLAMGIIQVPALSAWPDLVYMYQSIILLGAYALILFPLARDGWRGLPPQDDPPVPAVAPGTVPAVSG